MPPKKSKNQLRRERLKAQKSQQLSTTTQPDEQVKEIATPRTSQLSNTEFKVDLQDPTLEQFQHVFQRFQAPSDESPSDYLINAPRTGIIEDEKLYESVPSTASVTTVKPKKYQPKILLTTLKSLSPHPEVVTWQDADARDPILLITLKSAKNAIPIPTNWSSKSAYLASASHRKTTFTLPEAIAATGIAEMRDPLAEEDKSLKEKQRAKVRPKMGALDLDYQRLYDAFFKNQKKPKLLALGEIYSEDKAREDSSLSDVVGSLRPGVVSKELREALGVVEGGVLPWVQKMKEIGLPPAYPDLLVPGLNVPLEGVRDEILGNDEELGIQREMFGKLVDGEESDAEEEEEQMDEANEVEEEEEPVVVTEAELLESITAGLNPQQEPPTQTEIDHNSDEDIPIPSVLPTNTSSQQPMEPKQLYKFIKEKFVNDEGSLLGATGKSYDLGIKRSAPDVAEGETTKKAKVDEDEDKDDEDADGKFKF